LRRHENAIEKPSEHHSFLESIQPLISLIKLIDNRLQMIDVPRDAETRPGRKAIDLHLVIYVAIGFRASIDNSCINSMDGAMSLLDQNQGDAQ
jgi:hypothetical protein